MMISNYSLPSLRGAQATKQSSFAAMDCFAALAMTIKMHSLDN